MAMTVLNQENHKTLKSYLSGRSQIAKYSINVEGEIPSTEPDRIFAPGCDSTSLMPVIDSGYLLSVHFQCGVVLRPSSQIK